MQRSKTGGKGKKQCPGCSLFVGAVTKTCECGHNFFPEDRPFSTLNPNEIKTYTEGGRGRKQCAKCEKYIGARLKKCACGGEKFVKNKHQQVSTEVTVYDEGGKGKKQCAQCRKYVGNRVTTCACGSEKFVRSISPTVTQNKEITFYTEGGPGKKECAGCHRFLGARYVKCECGSTEFVKNRKEIVKEITTYDKGGPGKKQCQACKKYVGMRTLTCACGNDFPVKEESSASSPSPEVVEPVKPNPFAVLPSEYTLGLRHKVIAPAGKCPYKLTGTDEETVQKWAQSVIDYGVERDLEYTLSALKLWSHSFFWANTEESRKVKEALSDLEPVLYRHISEFENSDVSGEEE